MNLCEIEKNIYEQINELIKYYNENEVQSFQDFNTLLVNISKLKELLSKIDSLKDEQRSCESELNKFLGNLYKMKNVKKDFLK